MYKLFCTITDRLPSHSSVSSLQVTQFDEGDCSHVLHVLLKPQRTTGAHVSIQPPDIVYELHFRQRLFLSKDQNSKFK